MSAETPATGARGSGEVGAIAPGSVASLKGPAWIENRPSRGWLPRATWGELFASRDLAALLARRDLILRYKQTFFGVAWAIIQPLATVAVFALVFGHFAHLQTGRVPYAVFAYAGLVIATYLTASVTAAAESLAQHRSLVTKVYFPRLLAPLAAVLPGFVDLLVSCVVLAVLMIIYGVTPGPAVALVPVWLIAAAALAFGGGTLLAALNVEYRDVRYALPFLMQLWFFASPIVYPTSLIRGAWRYVYSLNPGVGVIDGFRWSALGGPAPGAVALVSLASGIVLLAAALVYFGRAERRFADRI
jgi:lipopolysaccharide transport system permease protein